MNKAAVALINGLLQSIAMKQATSPCQGDSTRPLHFPQKAIVNKVKVKWPNKGDQSHVGFVPIEPHPSRRHVVPAK